MTPPITAPRTYALSGEAQRLYRLADADGNIISGPLEAIDLAAKVLDVPAPRLAWLLDGDFTSSDDDGIDRDAAVIMAREAGYKGPL